MKFVKYLLVVLISTCLIACGGSDSNVPSSFTKSVTPPGTATTSYVYVVNYGDGRNNGSVSMFSIGSNGMLIPLSTPTIATGISPTAIVTNPAGPSFLGGPYVYVLNGPNLAASISQYGTDSNGVLYPFGPPTVTAGNYAVGIVGAPAPNNYYVYVINAPQNSQGGYNQGTVRQYGVANFGPLTPQGTVLTGFGPQGIAINPAGTYGYVPTCGNTNPESNISTVNQFAIINGVFTSLSPDSVTLGDCPRKIVINPAGTYVYVSNGGNKCTLSVAAIGSNGTLSPAGNVDVCQAAMAFNPAGTYLYAVSYTNGVGIVSTYAVGPGAALTLLGTVAAGPTIVGSNTGGASIAIDPTGSYAYVINSGNNTVSMYAIGGNGLLTPIGTVATGGTNPQAIAIASF